MGFAQSTCGNAYQELTTLWFPELAGAAGSGDEDRLRLLSHVVNRSWTHCRRYWGYVNPWAPTRRTIVIFAVVFPFG